MAGMPDGMDYWLGRKYGAIEMDSAARMLAARGNYATNLAQAGAITDASRNDAALLPFRLGNIGSQTTQNLSQGGFYDAQAHNLNALDTPADPLSLSTHGALLGPRAQPFAESYRYSPGGMSRPAPTSLGTSSLTPQIGDQVRLSPGMPAVRYAKGTARVPGKGSGKVDTQPAMLAPGEAVLNKPAAEHMGRGLIAALNQMGAQKLGLA